jgi:uncharacterized RDD family membrane protein YckC
MEAPRPAPAAASPASPPAAARPPSPPAAAPAVSPQAAARPPLPLRSPRHPRASQQPAAPQQGAGPSARAASFWRLGLAVVVDGLGSLVPALLAAWAMAPEPPSALSADLPLVVLGLIVQDPTLLVVFASVAVLASTLHHAILVPTAGATAGGLLAGLRLLGRARGERPGVAQAALRGLVSAVATLLFLSGPLFALWLHPLRCGPGDLVARTAPVRARA